MFMCKMCFLQQKTSYFCTKAKEILIPVVSMEQEKNEFNPKGGRPKIKEEDKFFEKFKKSPEYKKYTTGVNDVLFKKSLPRIVNFTTVPDPATKEFSETGLKNLYAGDPAFIDKLETFDGKIKFN